MNNMHAVPSSGALSIAMFAALGTVGCRASETRSMSSVDSVSQRANGPITTTELILISREGDTLARLAEGDGGEASLQLFAAKRKGPARIDIGLGGFGTPRIVLSDAWGMEGGNTLVLTNEGEPGEPSISLTFKAPDGQAHELKIISSRQHEPLLSFASGGKQVQVSLLELAKLVDKR